MKGFSLNPQPCPYSAPPGYWLALRCFRQSFTEATLARRDPWECPLTLAQLAHFNVPLSALQRLIHDKLVQHGRLPSRQRPGSQSLPKPYHGTLSAQSCFILTPLGVAIADELAAGETTTDAPDPSSSDLTSAVLGLIPWLIALPNGNLELWFKETLLRVFGIPESNMKLIALAFHEQHWVHHILDPIPPIADTDSAARLHDAIGKLKGSLLRKDLLTFHGDGTGKGIWWEELHSSSRKPGRKDRRLRR